MPASVTIAQSILESGWGRSYLTRRDHSYFGIKCFGNAGTIALGCRSYATTGVRGQQLLRHHGVVPGVPERDRRRSPTTATS